MGFIADRICLVLVRAVIKKWHYRLVQKFGQTVEDCREELEWTIISLVVQPACIWKLDWPLDWLEYFSGLVDEKFAEEEEEEEVFVDSANIWVH